MTMIFEEGIRKKTLVDVAERMLVAARTAPKARGIDNLVISYVEKDDIEKIAAKMKELVDKGIAQDFFVRDADNILEGGVVVLIGTRISPMGLNYCGLCGFKNCEEKLKHPDNPCAFNTNDLGIAIGSAVSVAMEARVDNRVMYSVGMAVKELKLMGDDVKVILAIPLSAGPKSPFFDRK